MNDILDMVFNEVLKEDFVEVIPSIPNRKTEKYAVCWRLVTEIEISQRSAEIELHIGFSDKFPYVLPDIYFLDKQYDYFPHIDYGNRKLCLFEEDAIIDAAAPLQVLRSCVRQAKKLIKCGINKQNTYDFIEEIASYWLLSYDKETKLDVRYLVYGQLKNKCLLNIITNTMGVKMIVPDDSLNNVKGWFEQYGAIEKVLFLPSLKVAPHPPYDIAYGGFWKLISEEDKKDVLHLLNRYSCMNILFPLSDNHLYGGFYSGYIDTNINGFRTGKVSQQTIIDTIYRNKKIPRIMANAYNNLRIESRTSGARQTMFSFAIIGCGSIGSNLCTFLNSYNNVSLTLVDNDIFNVDNIGRHVLGITNVFQSKVYALKNRLLAAKPEMKIKAYNRNVYDINPQIVSGTDAVFLCTGNLSAESYFFKQMEENNIKRPIFVLWLEPYAIAGHLVYISAADCFKEFRRCFDERGRYKYNLIELTEYDSKSSMLKKRDAGCNGAYTNYSGNDVMLFLSSMYPHICDMIDNKTSSMCYRWVGNINAAKENGIALTSKDARKNQINVFPYQE